MLAMYLEQPCFTWELEQSHWCILWVHVVRNIDKHTTTTSTTINDNDDDDNEDNDNDNDDSDNDNDDNNNRSLLYNTLSYKLSVRCDITER